jgi:hypothetical protein
MRKACDFLSRDFGVKLNGSVEDVKYKLQLGEINIEIDWDQAHGNGAHLSVDQIQRSGVLDLVTAVTSAVGVWYNVSKGLHCYNTKASGTKVEVREGATARSWERSSETNTCAACPPCQNCPSCPVSHCAHQNASSCKYCPTCSFKGEITKTFAWDGVTCNDDLNLINTDLQGTGHDMFWPPNVKRNTTVETLVGSHRARPAACGIEHNKLGLLGSPVISDPWSGWLTSYYGGLNITHHRNIVWSNGALDPWSGAGVYPPGGGPEGPLLQNISADGSQVALVIDLGGHHLDLFFADENDPDSVVTVRRIEEDMVTRWCQEWYDDRRSQEGLAVVI